MTLLSKKSKFKPKPKKKGVLNKHNEPASLLISRQTQTFHKPILDSIFGRAKLNLDFAKLELTSQASSLTSSSSNPLEYTRSCDCCGSIYTCANTKPNIDVFWTITRPTLDPLIYCKSWISS
uniref:Uncharacterized protein n=1 Tax=Opuntia streptacantha TaxID=393608 RepID=A0A7C9DM19_OPUST